MVGVERSCAARSKSGEPCGATPMTDGRFCFWHEPEQVEAAGEARRLGGQRRRRESVVAGSFGIESLDRVADLRRLLWVVVTDTLAMENSANRSRILIAAIGAGAKLLEVGELVDRLAALETTLRPRQPLRAVGGKR